MGTRNAAVLPEPSDDISNGNEMKFKQLTGLGTGQKIVSLQGRRDAVTLDGRWLLVPAEFDVLEHDGMQASFLELVLQAMD